MRILILTFSFTLFLISCKTREKSSADLTPTIIKSDTLIQDSVVKNSGIREPISREPLKEKVPEQLFNNLKKNELKYEWIKAKFDASVTVGKKTNSFSGNIRIRRDSIIWISITPAMGIEMFRIILSNDSIKMLNRLESTYSVGNFKYFSDLINADVDFDMLLAFITGNDFAYYENDVFKSSIDEKKYRLSTVGRRKLRKIEKNDSTHNPLSEDIWINTHTFKIEKHKIHDFVENRKFEAQYSNFTDMNGQWYPQHIYFEIKAKEDVVIELDFTRFEIDNPMDFPFNIPEKYNLTK